MAKLRFGVLGAAALITTYGLLGSAANADDVTAQFIISASGPSTAAIYSTVPPFAEFNPALGTLDEIDVFLSGEANWASPTTQLLTVGLNIAGTDEGLVPINFFDTPGQIAIDLGGAVSPPIVSQNF